MNNSRYLAMVLLELYKKGYEDERTIRESSKAIEEYVGERIESNTRTVTETLVSRFTGEVGKIRRDFAIKLAHTNEERFDNEQEIKEL